MRLPGPVHRTPRWSPDGRRLLYTTNTAVFVVGADGRGSHAVTPRGITEISGADWAPDGARIVYTIGRGSPPANRACRALYIVALGDPRPQRIPRGDGCVYGPAWSPDGRWIAYNQEIPGFTQLRYSQADGRGTHHLTDTRAQARWSPLGRSLAFAGDEGLTSHTFSPHRVTELLSELGMIVSFAWAPDGSSIAVERDGPIPTSGKPGRSISVVRPDGSGLKPITQGDSDTETSWQPVCTIYGTAGADVLAGTAGADVICGLGGADRIRGGGGDDLVIGGDGTDLVYGGAGRDRLFGSAGDDAISAHDGEPDVLDGGPGTDEVSADRFSAERTAGFETVRRQ